MKTIKELLGLSEAKKKKMEGEDPCWDTHQMVGMKKGKNGKPVPNCVPKNEEVEIEEAKEKTPEDYEILAKKHNADGQKGTRANMVYASMMAGRARRAAAILKKGGSQEDAWKHYQGTNEEVEIYEAKVGDTVSFHHELKAAPGTKMKKSGTVEKVQGDDVLIKVKDKYGVKRHQVKMSDLVEEDVELEEMWRVEKSEATGRHHIVKGYNDKRKVWKNKIGAGDFNSESDAKKKAEELNSVKENFGADFLAMARQKNPNARLVTPDQKKKEAEELAKKRAGLKPAHAAPTGNSRPLGGHDPKSNRSYSEEVEQVDELNKDTVYSYNKKSTADTEKLHKKLGEFIRRNKPAEANKTAHKLNKRVAGQERADARLNTEEAALEEAKAKKEETPSKKDIVKGEKLSGKQEPVNVNPELKEK